MSGTTSRRIDDIEVLRAFAILFVLLEHLRFNLFPWNVPAYEGLLVYFQFWSGVDIFLAISGFVIARSLLPTLTIKSGSTAFLNDAIAFWLRRFWRLAPSAWLWLLIILAASLFFNRSGTFSSFHTNFVGAVAALLNIANFRTAYNFGLGPLGASFPYWSLSLEEQFYILLPFVIYLSGRRLPLVLFVVIALQFFTARSGSAELWSLILNQTRCDALAFGVLIAIWTSSPSYHLFEPTILGRSRIARVAFLFGGLGMIAAVSSVASHIVFFSIGVVALISATLVFVASYDRDYLWKDGASKRLLLWIGSRSYALYLIHIPVYFATRELFFRFDPLPTQYDAFRTAQLMAVAAILLFGLAELNYRFVETPLRRRGVKIAQQIKSRVPATV